MNSLNNILPKAFIFWIFSSLILLLFTYLNWGMYDAASCLAGELIVGFNLLTLIWTWQRIFNRKGLALAVGVIVFKYAIFVTSAYFLITYQWVSVFGFLIGCSVLPIVLMVLAFEYNRQNN